jgi:diadenosine tetraphosphate (Ap4A) HIT family hydrolase
MPEIKSLYGIKKKIKCIGCSLQKGKIKTLNVMETKNFNVSQDYETPIPGFLIISSKKHVKGIENFSKKEREELIELLYKIRVALTKILKIKNMDIIHEEISIERWSHFHVWLFPRYNWTKKFGESIDCIIPSMRYAQKNMRTEKNLKEVKNVAEKLRRYLLQKQQ